MKSIRKNIFREISRTKSRFFSILAIMAISTGFFSGIKAASPSMIETGSKYFENNHLMDIRLLSTVGFDDDDIEAISKHSSTVDVMPGYYSDLIMTDGRIDQVVRVYSLPEKTKYNDNTINETILTQGRYPSADNECVVDSYYFKSTECKLGDIITFTDKATDTLKHKEYKIVGAVSTPLYITYQRGNTNVGSGSIELFIMVSGDEFKSERYTDVYLTTRASQNVDSFFTDEYKEKIDKEKEEYEELSKERIKIFNETTYTDSKNQLADAQKSYNEKKSETEKKLTDAEKKLHDGERELQEKLLEGEQKLADGEKELEKGKKELEKAQTDYIAGIEEAKKKLTDAQTALAQGKSEYTNAKHTYDLEMEKAQSQLDSAKTEYNTQYTIFYGSTKPQAETKLSLLKTGTDLCNRGIEETEKSIKKIEESVSFEGDAATEIQNLKSKLEEYKIKLAEYQKQYDDGMAQLADGEVQLNQAKEKLDAAQLEFLTKKTEASDQLNNAQLQLDEAQAKLDNGKLEYETAMTTGSLQLQAAQSKVTQSEQELKTGREELENQKAAGITLLKESREKLATGKADAKSGLSDAEKKLSDAQKKIEMLDNAKWIISDRRDTTGYSGFTEDADRVDNVSTVFPVFFLLVAALVSLTTMSRMVEERRTEIGTLKALGYSNISIAAKYFIYAALASIIGSIIGGVIGVATLPFIILDTYSIMYILPKTVLVIPWQSFLFSAGTGMLCTCTVAVINCLGELVLNPATLMRPKAPRPGKRILLEYITPVWSRMNFTSKVTARNLFRYKARFFMTVIGVAGCTALIIGGLGLKDSIGNVADLQFNQITKYDEVFALTDSSTAENSAYILSEFHSDDRFSEVSLMDTEWLDITYNGDKKISVRLLAGENLKQFEKMFVLRDRITKEKIDLSNDGIVINERLADVTGKKVGDNLSFTMNNNDYSAKITALTENYAGNYVYITPEFYNIMTGKEITYNTIFTQLSDSDSIDEHQLANEYMKKDEIITVSLIKEQVEAIVSTLDSLNVIVFVLVFCAGLLAVVVLYNLTNINIAERVREIATIKVLGFYDMETANYIYRENTVLTIIGALVGLPLGMVFVSFIVQEIQMDMVMFPKNVYPLSFIIGFALTILFSLLVNFIMFFKMKKISMVESLKSIE